MANEENSSIFGSIIKGIGGITRDIVELGDSAYELTKDIVVDTAEGIVDIPKNLANGYEDGLISDGDHPKPDETKDLASKPVEDITISDTPGFKRPTDS